MEIFAESITDRTVAIFYSARPEERISLRALVSVARQFDLPVIVDAAVAQLPPPGEFYAVSSTMELI